jgi:hypothetical protein
METIDVGFKKFEVTRQAYIVFVALLIAFFAQLIILIFFVEDTSISAYMILILYIAVMIPLIVYANNCFVTGKCVVLSWVVSMIYVAIAVMSVTGMIALALASTKKPRRRSKKSSR